MISQNQISIESAFFFGREKVFKLHKVQRCKSSIKISKHFMSPWQPDILAANYFRVEKVITLVKLDRNAKGRG